MKYLWIIVLSLITLVSAQSLSVTLHPDGLAAPEATNLNGYVPITFISHAEQEFNFSLSRLKNGVRIEDFTKVSQAVNAAFGEDSTTDPRPGMTQFLEMADLAGGVLSKPGEAATAYIKLEPGTYVIEASPNESGNDYFYSVLNVTEGETLATPQADLNLVMVDHHFSFPATLKAGPQRWQVSNMGQQAHFAVIFKLAEGKTQDDFQAWMATAGPTGPAGPPPFDMEASYTGFIQAISSGQDYYVDVNLPVGNYVALCFLPDMESEKSHVELGMMSSFSVE